MKAIKEHTWCQLWASTCMRILLHLYPHRLKMCTPQTHAKKMGCHVNVCVACVCREGSSELWISPGAILWNKWIPKKIQKICSDLTGARWSEGIRLEYQIVRKPFSYPEVKEVHRDLDPESRGAVEVTGIWGGLTNKCFGVCLITRGFFKKGGGTMWHPIFRSPVALMRATE